MRKITELAYRAFMNDENFSQSNTVVKVFEDETRLELFGNLIARKDRKTKDIEISFAGWFSNTTKERLRPFANISTIKGNVFVNGEEVNSFEWILV